MSMHLFTIFDQYSYTFILLSILQERGVEVAQYCTSVVVDEVDACCAEYPDQMDLIMSAALGQYSTYTPVQPSSSTESDSTGNVRPRPEIVLVGATLDERLVEMAVGAGWLRDPVTVAVGQRMKLPASLKHRYIVSEITGKVGAMCRRMRSDLKTGAQDAAPARVMLFADSEAQARAVADPLRTVLWGEHAISVLLPGGTEPIKALHSFRDNQTTLLIATPAAARGLDLPAVSHVYNLSPPTDAADYLHRAGRAGRIGSPVRGLITTMVTPEEVPALLAQAEALGIKMVEEQAPPPPGLHGEDEEVSDVEEAKRALEAMLAFSPKDDQENESGVGGGSSGEWEE